MSNNITVSLGGQDIVVRLGENTEAAEAAADRAVEVVAGVPALVATSAQPFVDEAESAAANANAAASQTSASATAASTQFNNISLIADAFQGDYEPYDTKALADAATVAEDELVYVLKDESLGGARAIYRKVGAALQLKANLSDYLPNGQWITLEHFGGVGDGNKDTGTGTDNLAAMNAALAFLQANGGGELWLRPKTYRLAGSFEIPKTTAANQQGVKQQVPITIRGAGAHMAGQAAFITGGTVLMWTGSSGLGRIVAKGEGKLEITGCNLLSREGTTAGNGRPFIYHTNTVLHFHKNNVTTLKTFHNCDDDVVVSGGTGIVLGDGDNAPFQGYLTLIEGNYFTGIRRGWWARTYCNANRFINNNFWRRNGSNLTGKDSAAVRIDGNESGTLPDEFAVSNVVAWNLFEVEDAYVYGISLGNAAYTQLIGNEFYDVDETGDFIACIRQGSGASATYIEGSLIDNGNELLDVIGGNVSYNLLTAEDGKKSRFRALQAGEEANANEFGQTVFNGDSGVVHQFKTARQNQPIRFIYRSEIAATNPGTLVMHEDDAGAKVYGPGATNGGNVSVSVAGQAEYWANGKFWGFLNRAGGTMGHNTGTGGSFYDARQFSMRWYDHTGALYGEFRGGSFRMNGVQVMTTQQPAIADSTGSAADNQRAINQILATWRVHGGIAT